MSLSSIETVPLVIDGTTSSAKYYAPPPSVPARLVGMRTTFNASQSGEALIEAGKSGASHYIFSKDVQDNTAGNVVVLDYNDSATDAEKMQEFDNDTPVEVNVNLQSSAKVVVYLEFDPMMIGQGQDSTYA